jgi:hypothetical protein
MCVALAIAFLDASLWRTEATHVARGPRVHPSRVLADGFMEVLCRPPSDAETLDWDTRPFEKSGLVQALGSTDEAQRVRQIRNLYFDLLRRDSDNDDCAQVREWLDRRLDIGDVTRRFAGLPEAQRVSRVRQIFIETSGWDPRGWDDPGLRRWVDSAFTLPEIRSRLAAGRPLVGVHYFAWYLPTQLGWRNDLTTVPAGSPKPSLGWYDSGDTDVMATQIRQMETAGFDFVIVHVITQSPRTWANARTFIDRLSGHRLRSAVMLDGLNAADAAAKAMWVQKAKAEFAGDDHYLLIDDEPLIMLFSAPLDFDAPGVLLRNVYWTDRYDPGRNTFNPSSRLEPRDWPFWSAASQPLVNGVVPVVPGYVDTSLGRSRSMEYPRDNGQMYRNQWERALGLRPELILVYSWNEYFERTAIEPTDVWGEQYLRMTACYIAYAHRGTTGAC